VKGIDTPDVYQDAVPTDVEQTAQPAAIEEEVEKALTELTLNESVVPRTDASPTGYVKPTEKSRSLIASGIKRIRSKTLDPSGYRRLQGVIETIEVSEDNSDEDLQLDELLNSLIFYIRLPKDTLAREANGSRQIHDLKGQALQTIRLLYDRRLFDHGKAVPATISALLEARSYYKNRDEIVRSLEKTADQLYDCAGADPSIIDTCIIEVLNLAEEINKSEAPGRDGSIIMCLAGLESLVQRSTQYGTDAVAEDVHKRLGHTILTYLNSENPMIRRAAIHYCTELHQLVGELQFPGATINATALCA
jgi:CLIP-associating protein 1/2